MSYGPEHRRNTHDCSSSRESSLGARTGRRLSLPRQERRQGRQALVRRRRSRGVGRRPGEGAVAADARPGQEAVGEVGAPEGAAARDRAGRRCRSMGQASKVTVMLASVGDYYRRALPEAQQEVRGTDDARALGLDPEEWVTYLVKKYGMEIIEF